MNRIDHLFEKKKENILNIYFTAGYPALQDTTRIILQLADQGVDMMEIGMPYSDPMADGPTIQDSGSVAIKNGMTIDLLFSQLSDIRNKTDVPLLFMGYLNQLMQYGVNRFLKSCDSIGIDGLIVPDLPVDIYEKEFRNKIEDTDLRIIFLITPQTSQERIKKIDSLSSGFIYMVSNASITGAKSGISAAQIEYFERIKSMSLKNPKLIGFGISDHETFATACKYAEGAIIGSAFIKALGKEEKDLDARIADFVQEVRG